MLPNEQRRTNNANAGQYPCTVDAAIMSEGAIRWAVYGGRIPHHASLTTG
jgi:hypothetical protein